MSYRQIRTFDPAKGGSKAGYCLQNVRLGYGIPALYNDAWQAWNNTQQHRNQNFPSGVDIPLFYDYTDRSGNRYGHINVRLKDGRIWNDGRFYQSITSFQNSMSNVKYVGWGESVNNVRVIEEQDDMYNGRTAEYWALKNEARRLRILELEKSESYYMTMNEKRRQRILELEDEQQMLLNRIDELKKQAGGISAEDSAAIQSTHNIVKQIWDKLTAIFK